MDVFEAIEQRRSIRKYMSIPVEWDKIVKIIEAGKSAPSAGNLQNWRFVVCVSPSQRNAIAEACMEQYWMETAPTHIVVCSMPKRSSQFYGLRGQKLYDIQNCAAAGENMMLAATGLGLGSCWVGAFDETKINDIIKTDGEIGRAQAVITIGYPDEKPPKPPKYSLYVVTSLKTFGWKIESAAQALRIYGLSVKESIDAAKEAITATANKMKEKMVENAEEQRNKIIKMQQEKEKGDLEKKHKEDELKQYELDRDEDDDEVPEF